MVKRPHCNDEDLGSNPTATRKETRTMEGLLHRRCPGGPAGSEWKTSEKLTCRKN